MASGVCSLEIVWRGTVWSEAVVSPASSGTVVVSVISLRGGMVSVT